MTRACLFMAEVLTVLLAGQGAPESGRMECDFGGCY